MPNIRHLIALLAASALLVAGCGSQPDLQPIQSELEPAVLAVPGVTSGTLGMGYAELSPTIICELTGSGTSKEALTETLDAVLRVIVDNTRSLEDGSMVQCTIENGDQWTTTSDLDLGQPSYLGRLRERYP